MTILSKLIAHPLTRGKEIDSPETTLARREIIRTKPFLQALYREWYARILPRGVAGTTRVLEIGSGAGFLDQLYPSVITSEVLPISGIQLVANCQALPFRDHSLDQIVMVDVFHHIPNVARFLREASRCVRVGGRVDMIEPWRTPWSQWVYTHLHPEPFNPNGNWELPKLGPLSGANGALPWIVFERDKDRLLREHADWQVDELELMMPFAYLLSGGISTRIGIPAWCYRTVRWAESFFQLRDWAMFAHIGMIRQ